MSPTVASTNDHSDQPIYFWRETEIPYGFLSQWYTSPFKASSAGAKADETTFLTTEQWMMYQKAITFNDLDVAAKILKESSPKKQKSLGRKVANFDTKAWDKVKERIVEDGNYWKFTRGVEGAEKMKQALLDTGDRMLVEASPFDRIWGIGFTAANASDRSRKEWGQNLLGQALMKVRTRLRAESTDSQIAN